MDTAATVKAVQKLSPKAKEIVVLQMDRMLSQRDMVAITQQFREAGIESLLFFLEDESEIYVLDEERMATFGWVRKQ